MISVVIPVFNDPEGIQKLFPALLGQSLSFSEYEIVIVDNGSTDNTPEILENLSRQDNSVRVIEERIKGSYAARNRGVKVTEGEVLAFTDADCRPRDDWLEQGLQCLKDPAVGAAAGRIEMTFHGDRPNIWEYIDARSYLDQKRYVTEGGYGATANLFVKRRCFDEYGLFRSELRSGGDNEFGRRLTRAGEKVLFCPKSVVEHPARNRFGSLVKREIRVGNGISELHKLGVLDWNPLHPKQFLPRLSFPSERNPEVSLSTQKVAMVGYNLLYYINLLSRLGNRIWDNA